jgi:hypothetical protein
VPSIPGSQGGSHDPIALLGKMLEMVLGDQSNKESSKILKIGSKLIKL